MGEGGWDGTGREGRRSARGRIDECVAVDDSKAVAKWKYRVTIRRRQRQGSWRSNKKREEARRGEIPPSPKTPRAVVRIQTDKYWWNGTLMPHDWLLLIPTLEQDVSPNPR